jgi:uncharacterized protein (TIGR03084 family)
MSGREEVWADLEAECDSLDALVAGLDSAGWDTPTPAEGWTVKDQISHLASVDEWAALAAGDPERFRAWVASLPADDPDALVNGPVEQARSRPGADVLAWWRQARAGLAGALEGVDPAARAPWFGPSMAIFTLLTARLMETWAHGEDVAGALGVERPPTARLRHIAHLGVRTRGFAYASRGLPLPPVDVRVKLTGPGGETWTWGDEAAPSPGQRAGGRLLPGGHPTAHAGRHHPRRRGRRRRRVAGHRPGLRRPRRQGPDAPELMDSRGN